MEGYSCNKQMPGVEDTGMEEAEGWLRTRKPQCNGRNRGDMTAKKCDWESEGHSGVSKHVQQVYRGHHKYC
jgi:hypothetical protein